jgi:hypothetical protein
MLAFLGVCSIAIVIGFTLAACYRADHGFGQSRRASMVEAYINIAIGFGINFTANLVFLPLVGVHVTWSENLWLGAIYTSVSVVRSYVIRRYFNKRLRRAAMRIAGD